MGQKSLERGGRINVFFFCKKMYSAEPGRKKVAVITRWPYYRGGRKAGFHCNSNILSSSSSSSSIYFYLTPETVWDLLGVQQILVVIGNFRQSRNVPHAAIMKKDTDPYQFKEYFIDVIKKPRHISQ